MITDGKLVSSITRILKGIVFPGRQDIDYNDIYVPNILKCILVGGL